MTIQVSVVYSPAAREVREVVLSLPDGAKLDQALQASGLLHEFAVLRGATLALGIWGHKAHTQQILRDQDRVEIYRPLSVDPKVARRARFALQGARSAGLFVHRRPGAKAGY